MKGLIDKSLTQELLKPCSFVSPKVKELMFGLDDSARIPEDYYIWFNIQGNREVQQEYFIYGPLEFIGTVGGTLGLFVGFSFYDFIAIIIDFLFKNWIVAFFKYSTSKHFKKDGTESKWTTSDRESTIERCFQQHGHATNSSSIS